MSTRATDQLDYRELQVLALVDNNHNGRQHFGFWRQMDLSPAKLQRMELLVSFSNSDVYELTGECISILSARGMLR